MFFNVLRLRWVRSRLAKSSRCFSLVWSDETSGLDPFWPLSSWKSAWSCGAKHSFEVNMYKAPQFWSTCGSWEARSKFDVKMYKTYHVRTTLAGAVPHLPTDEPNMWVYGFEAVSKTARCRKQHEKRANRRTGRIAFHFSPSGSLAWQIRCEKTKKKHANVAVPLDNCFMSYQLHSLVHPTRIMTFDGCIPSMFPCSVVDIWRYPLSYALYTYHYDHILIDNSPKKPTSAKGRWT